MKLIRLEQTEDYTIGVLLFNSKILCYTLENPFIKNERNISCIPNGEYAISKTDSPKFGETFKIDAVPDRTNILFHTGNEAEDTQGCILLGTEVGYMAGDRAILNSRKAFQLFMRTLILPNYGLEVITLMAALEKEEMFYRRLCVAITKGEK